MTGSLYCGLHLKWDYNKRHVDLSMPGYIKNTLHKFHHSTPTRKQHSPHQWNTPIYGQKQQLVHQTPPLPQLSKQHTTRIQATVGTFLYYARSLDHTILVTI